MMAADRAFALIKSLRLPPHAPKSDALHRWRLHSDSSMSSQAMRMRGERRSAEKRKVEPLRGLFTIMNREARRVPVCSPSWGAHFLCIF